MCSYKLDAIKISPCKQSYFPFISRLCGRAILFFCAIWAVYNTLQHLTTLLRPWEQSQLFRRNQNEVPLLKRFIFTWGEKHAFGCWQLTRISHLLKWMKKRWNQYVPGLVEYEPVTLFWQWEGDAVHLVLISPGALQLVQGIKWNSWLCCRLFLPSWTNL